MITILGWVFIFIVVFFVGVFSGMAILVWNLDKDGYKFEDGKWMKK